jgi:signal transduction histidine kinase/DNA-binding response OmpR family regulator
MINGILSILLWEFWSDEWVKAGTVIVATIGTLIYFAFKIGQLKTVNADLQRQVFEGSELLNYAKENEKKSREIAVNVNRTKSFMVARINHEIRTPLNGMLGMTSLMSETNLTDEQKEYNEIIRDCGDALLQVVNEILLNDILNYSKIDMGKMELEQKDFSLEGCIEDAFDVFSQQASRSGVELMYELDPKVPTQIIGDSLRLGQIIMNLVESSLKYTSEGEISVTVKTAFEGEGNAFELSFSVKDSGSGIPADKLNLLAEDLSNPGKQDGNKSDVGLIISKKLVEQMGGSLKIETREGKGTTVNFTIRTMAGVQPRINRANDLGGITGKKILIVEGNVSYGNVLRNQLESLNLKPILVHTGHQALEVLNQFPDVDLLMTDYALTDLSSAELAATAKRQFPHLPVILLAPAGHQIAKDQASLYNCVVLKPVRKHVLNKQILSCFMNLERTHDEDPKQGNKLSAHFSETHPMKILIAEDNRTNQKLASKVLGKLGYTPEVAENGKVVLEMVSHKKYDLILMDVQMPEMDGMETTRMIRLCLNEQPVIVAMTANTLHGDRENCLLAGMDDYIAKPIKLEELVDVLEKWSLQIHAKGNKLN